MEIILTLPYPDAAKYATIWASEEEQIDFRGKPDRADRCTLSFAACELQKYLKRSGHKVSIATDASPADAVISFCLSEYSGVSCSFSLAPTENGCAISGADRTGVLYGAYAIAEMQSWRFLSYENDGERLPDAPESLCLPKERIVQTDAVHKLARVGKPKHAVRVRALGRFH